MKLPKTAQMKEWQDNPETRVFARELKKSLGDELFVSLRRACRSSMDPAVRDAWARYQMTEEIVKLLEGRLEGPVHDDQSGDNV